MRIALVTPTYNERDNIAYFIENVFKLNLPGLSIFVVDDNSPDGTADIAKKYPVTLLSRPRKMGLGTAYRDAFKNILEENFDFVIQMDADLSHDPADIPRFLEAIKDCDLVLGSRYIRGGGIKNWGWARCFISRCANFYSRMILSLPYHDLTGGYKCFRREVLRSLVSEPLSSAGYSFQIEITYKAHKQALRIKEIPIVFYERTSGKSKFNLFIIIESFLKVLQLRFYG